MNRRHFFALSASLVAALSACGGADESPPSELTMRRIAELWGLTSLNENYVIRNAADWQTTWEKHQPPATPSPQVPAIDFSREMVIGLTRGTGSSGCNGLYITRIIETESELKAEFAMPSAPVGTGCTAVLVPLTDFVVVQASPKPVRFELAPGPTG